MARLARVAVPGYCYHVTHRATRRSRIFFERLRVAMATGRPCGDETFVRIFAEKHNRLLLPQKPGPKPVPLDSDDALQESFR